MTAAIRVENLGKCYRLNHRAARMCYRTLRESLGDWATAPLRRWRSEAAERSEPLWALKDVNLELQPRHVVRIIRRNGPGTSTLLKILSRITKPTTGEVRLRGRVGP